MFWSLLKYLLGTYFKQIPSTNYLKKLTIFAIKSFLKILINSKKKKIVGVGSMAYHPVYNMYIK